MAATTPAASKPSTRIVPGLGMARLRTLVSTGSTDTALTSTRRSRPFGAGFGNFDVDERILCLDSRERFAYPTARMGSPLSERAAGAWPAAPTQMPQTVGSNRQRRRLLDGAQRKRRLHPDHAGQLGQDLGVDALEVGGVGIDHAHHIVRRAGQEAAFRDFGMALHGRLEGVERGPALLVERNEHEGDAGKAGRRLVEQHDIARDETALLQELDPAQAGRGRQVDPFRKVDIGQPAIRLKEAQDGAIAAVEVGCTGLRISCDLSKKART